MRILPPLPTRPHDYRGRNPLLSLRRAVLALGLAAGLTACSDEAGRRPPAQTEAPPAASAPAESGTATPSAGAAGRYQVLAEVAYFFDSAQPGARPRGPYLRRGDVLYGEGETNGYVQTRFVQPNGATVSGWLKREELGRLAGAPTAAAPTPRRARPAPQPAPRPADPAPAPQTPAQVGSPTAPAAPTTAVVQAERAYFYNSAALTDPRRAYCEQGDKVRVSQEQGDAVYVTFTNWEKVTTRGWMKKDDLRFH